MVHPMLEISDNHHHTYDHHLCNSAPIGIGLFLTISALVALCAHHNHRSSSKKTAAPAAAAASSEPKHLQQPAHEYNGKYKHTYTKENYLNIISSEEEAVESLPKETSTKNHTTSIEAANKNTIKNTNKDRQRLELLIKDTAVPPPRSPLKSSLIMSPLRTPLMDSPKRLFTVLSDKATTIFSTTNHKTRPGPGGTREMTRRASHYDKRLEAAFYDGISTSDDDEDELNNLKGDEEVGAAVWQKNILMGGKCRPLEFSGVIYYDDCGNKVPQIPRSPAPSRSFTFPMSKDCTSSR